MANLNETPRSSRLHIAIFGRRNAGKSSLLNALTGQPAALVSEYPGTTTDPVYKAMEILPLGPVVLIDTPGLDDTGPLGELRVQRSYETLKRTDLAIVVLGGEAEPDEFEFQLVKMLKRHNIPVVGVINKIDQGRYSEAQKQAWQEKLGLELIPVSAVKGSGINELKSALIKTAPYQDTEPSLVGDLVKPGDLVLLVVPIDSAAPKGRLILPQQQVIRAILDQGGIAVVTQENRLPETLENLRQKPVLVITDSQVFGKVAADLPQDLPLTSFSIIFARHKGNLPELIKGAAAIESLKPGDRVLIAEACTHHRQPDDIGTVKIPRWLREKVDGELQFQWASGANLPDNLQSFKLIVHCGACMINRREMMHRLSLAVEKSVPMVNYGVLIAYLHGILPRAVEPFPEANQYLHLPV